MIIRFIIYFVSLLLTRRFVPLVVPMIGGLNLNDTNCVRHVQALQEAYGLDFFRGFGVVSLKHEGCMLNVTGTQTLETKAHHLAS